jgi:hypothetical protein
VTLKSLKALARAKIAQKIPTSVRTNIGIFTVTLAASSEPSSAVELSDR